VPNCHHAGLRGIMDVRAFPYETKEDGGVVKLGMDNRETTPWGVVVLITELKRLICQRRLGVLLSDFAALENSQRLLLTGSTLKHVPQRRPQ